jgi:hypothetical protein
MPLVLTQNEATESGHEYADVLGVKYEFPVTYRNLVVEGEQFVYYRGKRKAKGGLRTPSYLGTGVVGKVRKTADGRRLECSVTSFKPFDHPVPFKDGDRYLEKGASTLKSPGLHFRRGVRKISKPEMKAIIRAAGSGAIHPADSSAQSNAEEAFRAAVEKRLRVKLPKTKISLGSKTYVEVDGVSASGHVYVEFFAHVGALKSGQRRKVASDALKLVTLTRGQEGVAAYIAVCDPVVADYLESGTNWLSTALSRAGIKVLNVKLGTAEMKAVAGSQARNRLGNHAPGS